MQEKIVGCKDCELATEAIDLFGEEYKKIIEKYFLGGIENE